MSITIYDIFISYRRDGGGATAGRINDMLTADGYSVSYDVDTLREGRFDKQLLERIEQCQDFILVVDKNCFVRTIDSATNPQDDWLWQELSYALQLRKNVIPILLAGACFPKRLPEDIDAVRLINGPKCVHEYFDSFYSKLKDCLHSYPRMAQTLYPGATTSESKLPCLKLKADIDCKFYLDGEERSHLKAGVIKKIPLAKGEYELMFVSEEDDNECVDIEFEMHDADKLLKVNFCDIRNNHSQNVIESKDFDDINTQVEERRREPETEAPHIVKKLMREAGTKVVEWERCEEEKRVKEITFNVDGVSFKMIHVDGGSFMMGTPKDDFDAFDDEKRRHRVSLSAYYIGETQVTQALWKAVMRSNPSNRNGDNLPVDSVSWDDCQVFINHLNEKTGKSFRLPTEAEWEYAARGGSSSLGFMYAGSNELSKVGWFVGNSKSKTHPVREKRANELGLYDMSGNVWEWCQDWYLDYDSHAQTNPLGPAHGSRRVLRGGGWGINARFCRVSRRGSGSPGSRFNDCGFRLALVDK